MQVIRPNPQWGCRSGGGKAPESVRQYNQWISYENRSLPDLMMGVETSILPFAMDAAAPKGAPRRPQLPDFLETVFASPCPARGPEAGSAHINCKYFTDFHGSGMNRMGSCTFLQSKKMNNKVNEKER